MINGLASVRCLTLDWDLAGSQNYSANDWNFKYADFAQVTRGAAILKKKMGQI
jgi:hypothetical protein